MCIRDSLESGLGDGALAQQDDSFHNVIVVEDGSIFFADGFTELSEADFRRLDHAAEIANPHWSSILHFDDRGGDVISSLHQANGADIQGLLAAFDESAAGVNVVGQQRILHLRERQTVRYQLARVELLSLIHI